MTSQLQPQTQITDPNTIGHPSTVAALTMAVIKYLRLMQQQMNRLSNGSINGSTTAATSPPAVGSVTLYAAGDFIRNSAPVVQGASGSQYVVIGWLCTVGGKPGTWVPCHTLTGT
jgi:hypothetical protein